MAVNIILWNYTGELNVVDKYEYLYDQDDTPLCYANMIGELRGAENVVTPEVYIDDNALAHPGEEFYPLDFGKYVNYAYIPEFGRYYFITDKTAVATDNGHYLWTIKLRCDVLFTYKNDILGYDAMIERNAAGEGTADWVPDDLRTYRSDKSTEVVVPTQTSVFIGQTGGAGTSPNFLVITAGRKV